MRRALVAAGILLAWGLGEARADSPAPDPLLSLQWYTPQMGLPQAWQVSRGSSAVTVAVLDTGVISTVPDFAGRLLSPISATGSAPFTDQQLLGSLRHGTWVASALAMGVEDGRGGAGVGNFSILPVTITNFDGLTSASWTARGIYMAADAGAKVINISYASDSYGTLDQAAAYARSKGALTFIAAGNSDVRVDRPAYPNLIFVTGTGRDDVHWSNGGGIGGTWGPFVDLAAPADDILVADPTLQGGYGIGDGTSLASPLAAGEAALAWSINPNLTPDQVENMLFSTAKDLGTPGWDEVFGWGRIDAAALASAAYASVPEPGTITILALGCLALLPRRSRREGHRMPSARI